MSWTPDQVRAHSLSDFAAAVEGFHIRNGGERPLNRTDVEALDRLQERYPDKVT